MADYFTEREFGPRPRESEAIDARVWGGLQSLIEVRIDDGSFGFRFPRVCSDDGREPYGTDVSAFARTMEAEIPWVTWPIANDEIPQTPVVLDILEFCAKAVAQPLRGRSHDFMNHTHIASWDRATGLVRFLRDVNTLFARNGIAFELTTDGRAQRLLPSHLGQNLIAANFSTGDRDTDVLLEEARRRFLAPKIEDRRDGLEKLWDAFERLKTLEPGSDKKITSDKLLDRAARPESKLRRVLADEADALTRIGNTHRIRHSEVWQEPLESTAQVDFLFGRLFTFIHLLLAASGRLA